MIAFAHQMKILRRLLLFAKLTFFKTEINYCLIKLWREIFVFLLNVRIQALWRWKIFRKMIRLNFAELLIPFMSGHKNLSYEIETSKKIDGGGLIVLILCFIWGLKNVLKHQEKLGKDAKDEIIIFV